MTQEGSTELNHVTFRCVLYNNREEDRNSQMKQHKFKHHPFQQAMSQQPTEVRESSEPSVYAAPRGPSWCELTDIHLLLTIHFLLHTSSPKSRQQFIQRAVSHQPLVYCLILAGFELGMCNGDQATGQQGVKSEVEHHQWPLQSRGCKVRQYWAGQTWGTPITGRPGRPLLFFNPRREHI